jgi:hypothetical protein
MAKNTSVMGIYSDRTTVSDAISVLQKAGYRPTDISVLSSENRGSKDFALEKRTKALEGAAIGAAGGAAIGAVLAWLVSVQTVTVTFLSSLVAAGPLLATIAGLGAGTAAGWLLGLLTGSRQPEYVAKRYEGRIRRGGILLSVHCDTPEWCDRAKKTLRDTGAVNVSAGPESAADFGSADKPTERAPLRAADRIETPAELADPIVVESKR